MRRSCYPSPEDREAWQDFVARVQDDACIGAWGTASAAWWSWSEDFDAPVEEGTFEFDPEDPVEPGLVDWLGAWERPPGDGARAARPPRLGTPRSLRWRREGAA
jgi:hypothetical protein